MRFLVIDFEIIERGGINRIVEGLRLGLTSAGHTYDYTWASRGGNVRNLSATEPTMINGRYFRLPAKQISYGKKDSASKYAALLEDYDVVMFMLSCPHDNKGNQGDMSWKMLYEVAAEKGKPIIGVIHDNFWNHYYGWYRDVSDLVQFNLYTCYNAKYDSLARLPGNHVFLPTPLDVSQAALFFDEKNAGVCWMPQWKVGKGIYIFLNALPEINAHVNLYNAGIEYHKARQTELWKRVVGINHVNRKRSSAARSDREYWGAQLPANVPGIYRAHSASVDLTSTVGKKYDGLTSCIMLEAMLYGCVSVVSEGLQTHDLSILRPNPEVVWGVGKTSPEVAAGINQLMADKKLQRRTAKFAQEWVVEYADAHKAARLIEACLDERGLQLGATVPQFFNDPIATETQVPVFEDSVYNPGPYVSKNSKIAKVEREIPEEIEEAVVSQAELQAAATSLGLPVTNRTIGFLNDLARAWLKNFGDLS